MSHPRPGPPATGAWPRSPGPTAERCTPRGPARAPSSTTPRGNGGFGYDPIFVPEGERARWPSSGTRRRTGSATRSGLPSVGGAPVRVGARDGPGPPDAPGQARMAPRFPDRAQVPSPGAPITAAGRRDGGSHARHGGIEGDSCETFFITLARDLPRRRGRGLRRRPGTCRAGSRPTRPGTPASSRSTCSNPCSSPRMPRVWCAALATTSCSPPSTNGCSQVRSTACCCWPRTARSCSPTSDRSSATTSRHCVTTSTR